MTLPLLISVPHAGLLVPPEAEPYCGLTAEEIEADGDVGAAQIYDFPDQVEAWISSEVARAVVDLNRAVDDRRKDGVIKTHTCWDVPVYRKTLPESVAAALLERYYHPYHRRLSAPPAAAVLGVDCHTMAAVAPPVAPDPGAHRPQVCLSHAGGTCPETWLEELASCFGDHFDEVALNTPFTGGYIIRAHAAELPWVQLELSRAAFAPLEDKRRRVLAALSQWCARHR